MPSTTLRIRLASWLLSALVVLCWAVSPATGQEYTIGPRDVLGITVWGQADLSREYGVDPDGFVRGGDGRTCIKRVGDFGRRLEEVVERA